MIRPNELNHLVDELQEAISQVRFGEVSVTLGIQNGQVRTSKLATSRTHLHIVHGDQNDAFHAK